MLPRRIPKQPKRSGRWTCQSHRNFVRKHACSMCDSTTAIEVAHVRFGSGAGLGQKPDDWRTVSLCSECHRKQHTIGEQTFWKGHDVEALIESFIKASPKRREIMEARNG